MSDVPDLSSDEEHFDEDEWQEMDSSDTVVVTCLFCTTDFTNIDDTIRHCENVHNFKLLALKLKFNMDCYSYIKMINYIKTHKPLPETIMKAETIPWEDEIYLKPVENDEWLMYDIESLSPTHSPQAFHANIENGVVTLSQAHFLDLQRTIQNLTQQLQEKDIHLKMAREDLDTMRQNMNKFIENGGINGSNGSDGDSIVVNSVAKVSLEDDAGYFNSYAHFGIHYDMLSDKVRTESYKKAILDNAPLIKDKLVLDLGCGTGILSMFAATAGAKLVYALDQSEVVFHAMDIIRENNLHDKIKVIKGRLENTQLDEKVDIIVSEWMGYFLLFEGMLDSVVFARDNWLKPNGLLLPNRCNISLVANGDVDSHEKFIEYWSSVYGFKMNCMKSEVVREASIDVVDSKHILTGACVVKDIDINTCTTDVMDFRASFSLPVLKDGFVTSLVGYFDTFFDLQCNVSFSTGPQSKPTHWKQTIFYFRDCKQVKKGDVIEGMITCTRQKSDVRALKVYIDVFGKTHKYILS